MSNELRETINKKIVKSVSRKVNPESIDKEQIDNATNKVLNSYIKYLNKKVNQYHKNDVEIVDNVDYNEKIVLFD